MAGAEGWRGVFQQPAKALFDLKPLLGDTNPYTTVLRGLALTLLGSGVITGFAGVVGPFLAPIAITLLISIGFFNMTILLEGLFYAKLREGDGRLLANYFNGKRPWYRFLC